jgi:hypothetical protein
LHLSISGKGRLKSSENADPHIGEVNKLEIVEEEQVSVNCDLTEAKQIVTALRAAHPYEEPLIGIFLEITQLLWYGFTNSLSLEEYILL